MKKPSVKPGDCQKLRKLRIKEIKRDVRNCLFMSKILKGILLLLLTAPLALSQSWMNGKWEGKGYQIDTDETWTVKLRVHRKKFVIEYPSLKCSGEWKLINFNKKRARFKERIKVNPDECEDRGNVIIQRLDSKQLLFIYSYKGISKVIATAVLNRKN